MKKFFNLISSEEFYGFFDRFDQIESETIPLMEGLGRFAAEDITAPETLPPFSRSTMDGFSVRARDTFGASETEPAFLEIIGEIPMGESGKEYTLRPGQTARIWTGGELAEKSDAVVMFEYTHALDDSTIEVFRSVAPGENVIHAGEDFEQGATIVPKGTRLRSQDLGVLAGMGLSQISVVKKPVVAIISTGDELVPVDQAPPPGKIRDINSTTLSTLVIEAGGTPKPLGIIHDDFDLMLNTCSQAIEQGVDMILLSGGSSVGKRDFTLSVFKELDDSELLAHGVAIRPGKPTILGRKENCALLGLPGHTASAMVVFYLFVRPLLQRYLGSTNSSLTAITAITDQQIPSSIGREEYVRVRLHSDINNIFPIAVPIYGKSGLLKPLVASDGLLVIDRDCEGIDKGQQAKVLLFP